MARERKPGVIVICKTVLSGSTSEQIRDQVDGLAPTQLRDLAVQLAGDPDLTVSVITYDDGRLELEVLHTGPPHRTEHTIDRSRFTGQPQQEASRMLSIVTSAGLQDAVTLVRSILLDAAASLGGGSRVC
jgi:hypothetical protein